MGVVAVGETDSLPGESVGGDHRVLEHTEAHPLRNQLLKGATHLCVVGEVTESLQRAEQATLFLL